jgi:predicted ATP-binding protein involved in virulence
MKIESVTLKNFRCFKDITVSLHPNLTILVAENGKGKTSILDAIRIGLWPYVGSFDLAKTGYNDPTNTITLDDVKWQKSEITQSRQLPSSIRIDADLGDSITRSFFNSTAVQTNKWSWSRYRSSEAPRSQLREDPAAKILKHMAKTMQDKIRKVDETPVDLPIFGYYGTGRLWKEKRLTANKRANNSRNGEENTRTFAYRDCLDPASSYKQFEEWFTTAFKKIRELQFKQIETGSVEPTPAFIRAPVIVVQKAVDEMLQNTGWKTLEYSEVYDQSLVLHHPESGVLKVYQLSDGIKNMLALVADIAYRCVLLNPHLGEEAAKQSQGLVMIDEIDMHLHPGWQQTVATNLVTAFPNIQFIVTTHSPQVLSSVHRESIRLLGKDSSGKDIAAMPIANSYAEISSDVLQAIMHVDPMPPVKEKFKLARLIELVDQGHYDKDEAKNLMKDLTNTFSESHPQVQKLMRSIKRQEILKS